MSTSEQPVKKLGELLLESGCVSQNDLDKAVDVSRKNFQSLGKVLIAQKVCRDSDITNALEIQKVCKLEGMSGALAVRALALIKKEIITVKDGLQRIGWTSDNYKHYDEPAPIVEAKKAAAALGTTSGIAYGEAVEKIGDAYLEAKLAARAECKYEEAKDILEQALPESAKPLSLLLGKLSKLAVSQRRHDEAKAFLDKAHAHLVGTGNKESREFVKVIHASAEYHVSRRKFSDAEQHFKDCFAMLEAKGDYHDPELIETIRRYVNMLNTAQRPPDQVTLGELFKGAKLLSDEDLTSAWQFSKKERLALGHALTTLKLVSEKHLQMALQLQMLVRNNEISAQLAIWIMLYMVKLGKPLDDVLALFNCEPKSRAELSGELKSATNEMANMEARLSPNHSELAFAHSKVAHIYFRRQQWTEAEHHFKRAMEIISVNPSVNAEKAIEVIDHYRDMKLAQEDWEGTIKVAKIGVLMRSKHYGQTSIPYAKGLERLGQIFCQKGDHSTAISCYDRALAVREKLYGYEDRELLVCLEGKGDCFMHLNDYTEGEATFDRAVAIANHTLGKHNEQADRLIQKLAEICKLLGKMDKAREVCPGSVKDHFFI